MSRDVLIIGDVVSFIERPANCATAGLDDNSPERSLITEKDWLALCGKMTEEEFIKSKGWKLNEDTYISSTGTDFS